MNTVYPFALVLFVACASSQSPAPASSLIAGPAASDQSIVAASDIEWEPLNPARGDAGPMAANLWGDRNSSGATGFLVRFLDGFKSPPHIHNVSYRGVVIRGLIHNDDASASTMWMPRGSFWTQPRGEAHITAARGDVNLAYIEIDEGPYLVHPVDQAFQMEQRPVNVDASNVVWLPLQSRVRTEPEGSSHPDDDRQVAFLWGRPHDRHPSGMFVKLHAGSSATLPASSATLRTVVIQGQLEIQQAAGDGMAVDPGSLLESPAGRTPRLSCGMDEVCVVYVRVEGSFDVAEWIANAPR